MFDCIIFDFVNLFMFIKYCSIHLNMEEENKKKGKERKSWQIVFCENDTVAFCCKIIFKNIFKTI